MKTTLALLATLLTLAEADRTIFVTPSRSQAEQSVADHPCLTNAFYGRYGRPLHDVYLTETFECVWEAAESRSSGSLYPAGLSNAELHLVWLQDAGLDNSIRGDDEVLLGEQIKSLLERLDSAYGFMTASGDPDPLPVDGGQHQKIISKQVNGESSTTLYYHTPTSALISIPASLLPVLDTFLPRFIVPVVLPSQPLANVPIPPFAVERIQSVLSALKFNPSIAAVVSGFNTETMQKDIRWLTGEADSGIASRHSFSSGARVAADWIQGEMEKSGAVCEQKEFSAGFSPNVICRYPFTHNTTATTILSAHYDSRGSFGSLRAPGGDDDGSGTTHVLAVARIIKEKRIAFKSRVELVLFAGEEQGLVGSRAYSHDLRAADANVTLHIQADMLAYRSPNEPFQLGLPDLIGLPEAAFLVANISKLYAPELTVGYTSACCSDHQSFHEQGFPATQVFERAGPIADPMYHNSGDVSNRTGYDFAQLQSIAKVTLASVLEVAGFDLVPVKTP